VCRKKFCHSGSPTHPVIAPDTSQSASTVRIAIFLRIDLILANTVSIGFRLGL